VTGFGVDQFPASLRAGVRGVEGFSQPKEKMQTKKASAKFFISTHLVVKELFYIKLGLLYDLLKIFKGLNRSVY